MYPFVVHNHFWRKRQRTLHIVIVLLVSCVNIVGQFLLPSVSAKSPIHHSSAPFTITGTVFDDYNQNGTRDPGEPGINGVVVTIDDQSNSASLSLSTSTIKGVAGQYSVTLPAGTGPVRVQFSNFGPSSTLPQLTAYQPSNHLGGTTVAFVDGTQPINTVNLGIERPSEYCQNNPQLATSCYILGNQTTPADPVIVNFPYNAIGTTPAPHVLAKAPEVGSTWGLAYHRASDTLFAASYIKSHAGLKPGGSTGAIYQIQNASTPTAQVQKNPFVDLNAVFGADTAGANPHDINDYDRDARAYDAPGKIGLGGLALSEDETTLYTMNLADRQLYSIALGTPPATPQVGHITHTPVPIPDDCDHNDFRPFAVSSYQGNIYVGAVCDGESTITSSKPIGDQTQLQAYVFLYTPGSGFTTAPVFHFPLNYIRRCANGASQSTCLANAPAAWRPWHPTYVETIKTGSPTYPQPMLTSIAFDQGNMILGLRDRYGDQLGFNSLIPQAGTRRVNAVTAGDILRACLNTPGDLTGGWSLETNASCGGIQTKNANTHFGPGNGEYYYPTTFSPYHDHIAIGGVLQIPGFPTVATTTFDPLTGINSAGMRLFNNTTGMKTSSYQVYKQNTPRTFAKANGLGALVALCKSAPLEIGNHIWFDKNNNGIQDAGEPSIAGVSVNLYAADGKTWLATTVTNNKGEYHFTINPYQGYVIKLDHLHDYTYGPLAGYQLAPANQVSSSHVAGFKTMLANTGNPLTSKAVLPNQSKTIGIGNFPQITINPHMPGENDYNQDIGFQVFKTPNTISGFVFDDHNQNGVHDAHDPGLNGVDVAAYSDTGKQVATSTTGMGGVQGWYELHLPADVGATRVQFENIGKTSTIPQLKDFAASNHQGGTAVAFVNDASKGVTLNLGIEKPSDYCQNNPQLVTSCYAEGDQTNAANHVVVSFPSAAGDTTAPSPLASAPEVGSTWGLAYRRSSDSLFVASYIKRHSGLAPGGSTGAIYHIQNASSATPLASKTAFVDLNKVFGAKTAGANPHTLTNYNLDPGAYDAVGKVGLGGMALSEDESTLYVMNLADRQLYSIPLGAAPAPPVVGKITRIPVPRPANCPAKDSRPFAVTAYNDGIYVGGVCSAESTITKKIPGGDASKLFAFVQLYTPGKGFSAKPVFTFPLNYPRHCANGATLATCTKYFNANWNPWHPTFTMVSPNAYPTYPQPMLTGITFDNGDMVLGLRDRYGDQVGWGNPSPNGGQKLFGIPAGDLLRACLRTPHDSTTGWNLEYNATCGESQTNGKDNAKGPGGGNYYYEDDFLPFHDHVGLGGVYQIPGSSTVISTTFNPTYSIDSAGVRMFDAKTGTNTQGYMVYALHAPNTFGKANGVGSVVALCQAAPIEIGNRIWDDANGNGIQDADESTIAGVTVNLYKADGTTLLQTAISDANGEYYFKIDPYTPYVIKLDNATDYSTGPLTSAHLTLAKQDTHTFDTDSKATLPDTANPIGTGNYPEIAVSAHTPGENDHNLDIGFTGVTPHISSATHPRNAHRVNARLEATTLDPWERRKTVSLFPPSRNN